MPDNLSIMYDNAGRFRIYTHRVVGKWVDYKDIATLTLEVNGKIEQYVAVSGYGLGDGALLPERVYKVELVKEE